MNKKEIQKLNQEERKAIQELIDKLSKDPEIYGLIRYGSSVESSNFNDIDLCIVSQKDIAVKKKYQYRVFLPEKFDIHFFHDLPLYIQNKILKNAINEYIKDYNNFFDICVESIKRYSLFKPHYKLYLEAVLDS